MSKSKVVGALAVAAALTVPSISLAAFFNPGDIAVYRVGNGASNVLASTGSPIFIDSYSPTGVLRGSVALPTTGSNAVIASGTATSEGLLTVSPNGLYITVTGYNAALGGSTQLPGSSTTGSSAIPRAAVIISTLDGSILSTTRLTDWSSGNNPRSAVTDDGTNLWVAGAVGGVRYTTAGSTTSTQLTTLSNVRQVNIFGGNLYVSNQSTASSNAAAIGQIGTGLPTSVTPTVSLTGLPGFPSLPGVTAQLPNAYQFVFLTLSSSSTGPDTLYYADATTAVNGGGGIRKYSLVSGTWNFNGVVGSGPDFYTGLSGIVDAFGNANLYAVRTGGSSGTGGGQLVNLLDTSGYNGTFSGTPTVVASATTGASTGTNTAFRGIGVVPEPAALGLLIPVAAVVAGRRRR